MSESANPKYNDDFVPHPQYNEDFAPHAAEGSGLSETLGNAAKGVGAGFMRLAKGVTYGTAPKIGAAISSAIPGNPDYQHELATIEQALAAGEQHLPPGAAPALEMAGSALSPITKAVGPIAGAAGAGKLALLGGLEAAGHANAGPLKTAKQVAEGAAGSMGLGALAGAAPNALPSAIARRYPALADRMARVLTNMPADIRSKAARLANKTGTVGQYAEDVTGMGLQEPLTPRGRMIKADQVIEKQLNPAFETARSNRSAPLAEVERALSPANASKEAQGILERYKARLRGEVPEDLSGGAADELKMLRSSQAAAETHNRPQDPDIAKRITELTQGPSSSTDVPMNTLGQISTALRADVRKPPSGLIAGDVNDLRAARNALGDVELANVAPESQGGYRDLLRRRAVAEQVAKNSSEAAEAKTTFLGHLSPIRLAGGAIGTALGAPLGPIGHVAGGLAGMAAGAAAQKAHPAARAILKAYATKTPGVMGSIASHLATTPGRAAVANAFSQALDKGDEQQAAVELYKDGGFKPEEP